ncbi:unnamed protein product [Amoebophrya sp. A25]|nr:unnamed protein product [Amoebophrya sp. A25]|eukprot:GSA25T00009593001.1
MAATSSSSSTMPSGVVPLEPQVSDSLDVTVLAFAQWISEMRSRTNSNLQQILAEMGIIRNGITSNSSELSDFKRHCSQVQQQQQSQLSDLRQKLQEAYNEMSEMKKAKAQSDQEMAADYQTLAEQLNIKSVELDTIKKTYAQTTQQLQQQILELQTEVNEVRLQREDTHRMAASCNENLVRETGEIAQTARSTATEFERVKQDHDHAIANLAENMNRWNDTIRDLSKEFHEFQKLMTNQQARLQMGLDSVQHQQQTIPAQQGVVEQTRPSQLVVAPPQAQQRMTMTTMSAGVPQQMGSQVRPSWNMPQYGLRAQ